VIAAIAARQHGLITYAQMIERGVSPGAIETRVRRGSLNRVYRAVYSVGTPPRTREARWGAAVLACGPDALLAFRSAAAHWGIRPSAATVIDVCSATRAGRGRDGIRVHRATALIDADRSMRAGIPLTAVPRTIVDLATVVPPAALEYAIHRAEAGRLVTLAELHAILARLCGHPGTRAVRAIVGAQDHELVARARGRRERRFLALCQTHAIPPPRVNEWIALPIAAGGLEVDFYWPDARLVVEIDEWRSHGTARAFRNDRARDRALGDAGVRVLRFAERELDDGPPVAAAVLRALASGRARSPTAPRPAWR
jgi:hypothetical protein